MLLFERTDLVLRYQDPPGRDRAISSGAAVANLRLGLRMIGRGGSLSLLPDTHRPELVARFTMTGTAQPSDEDRRWHAAITRRRSYRRQFTRQQVSAARLDMLLRAAPVGDVRAIPLRDPEHLAVLAG